MEDLRCKSGRCANKDVESSSCCFTCTKSNCDIKNKCGYVKINKSGFPSNCEFSKERR